MTATILHGNCLDVLNTFPDNYFDSANIDPPAGISFMGKAWDKNKVLNPKSFNLIERHSFAAFIYEMGTRLYRVMKPGAYGTIWALPKTSHWTATALEFAGFEIRDVITHHFGSGFPKNLDISKQIDLIQGKTRNTIKHLPRPESSGTMAGSSDTRPWIEQSRITGYHETFDNIPISKDAKKWQGYGTALKPASEFWLLIQKPISESSIAKNVLKWGVGGINIDACRVVTTDSMSSQKNGSTLNTYNKRNFTEYWQPNDGGRFPANLVFSHTLFCLPGECADGCPIKELDRQSGVLHSGARKATGRKKFYGNSMHDATTLDNTNNEASEGGASRFFNCFDPDDFQRAIFLYTAKPSRAERNAGTGSTPVEFGAEVSDAIEPAAKVFNGQSARPSSDLKDVEKRFSTGPAANNHPTVKSTNLIGFLQTLTTPPGGLIIDATAGSATGGVVAIERGFNWVGIEMDERYFAIAQKRLEFAKLPPEVKAAQGGQIYIDWLKEFNTQVEWIDGVIPGCNHLNSGPSPLNPDAIVCWDCSAVRK